MRRRRPSESVLGTKSAIRDLNPSATVSSLTVDQRDYSQPRTKSLASEKTSNAIIPRGVFGTDPAHGVLLKCLVVLLAIYIYWNMLLAGD